MRVWRICREAFAAVPPSGRGGLFTPGRWHTRENRIFFTAGSLSLAALEVLVHADRDTLPSDLVQLEIDVPDDLKISRAEIKDLPGDWNSYPGPVDLQRRGDEWLLAGLTPVLQVPSAVIPQEVNYLVNPQHADAKGISVTSQGQFKYDSRLAR